METFPRYWPVVLGIHRWPVNSPYKWPVTRSFDTLVDLRLNKRLSKQSWGWWFEKTSRPLWRHCNVPILNWLWVRMKPCHLGMRLLSPTIVIHVRKGFRKRQSELPASFGRIDAELEWSQWKSSPSAAYIRRWNGSSLVQVISFRLFSAKPLPEPTLVYCQFDTW